MTHVQLVAVLVIVSMALVVVAGVLSLISLWLLHRGQHE